LQWEKERKTVFPSAFRWIFSNFAFKTAKLLRLGKKKKWIFFVLRSTFRNFAIQTAKLLRLGKKRNGFLCFALDFP